MSKFKFFTILCLSSLLALGLNAQTKEHSITSAEFKNNPEKFYENINVLVNKGEYTEASALLEGLANAFNKQKEYLKELRILKKIAYIAQTKEAFTNYCNKAKTLVDEHKIPDPFDDYVPNKYPDMAYNNYDYEDKLFCTSIKREDFNLPQDLKWAYPSKLNEEGKLNKLMLQAELLKAY